MTNANFEHGVGGYRNRKCRCDVCRTAHTARQNEYNARRRSQRVLVGDRLVAPLPPDRHGRWYAYNGWGCRCELCLMVGRSYQRQYDRNRARKRARPAHPD